LAGAAARVVKASLGGREIGGLLCTRSELRCGLPGSRVRWWL